MVARNVLTTDNGKVFNITLDPGYCFAMSLDVAKVLLDFQRDGTPKKIPTCSALSPGKWAIVQSAYEINNASNDEKLIAAQNLAITAKIDSTDFNANFAAVANAVTALAGTSIFGIMGDGGGHELMWHRDDAHSVWLYLDPNDGLWRFENLQEAENYIANDLRNYNDLGKSFDAFTLALV